MQANNESGDLKFNANRIKPYNGVIDNDMEVQC